MNREIKFRGKSLETGEWVYGYYKEYLNDDNKLEYIITNIFGESFIIFPETIGQYIGLKDINEKEIYEGDIVVKHYKNSLFKDDKRIIGFLNGSFIFTNVPKIENQKFNTFSVFCTENGSELSDCWEVIGNKYDYPELIYKE